MTTDASEVRSLLDSELLATTRRSLTVATSNCPRRAIKGRSGAHSCRVRSLLLKAVGPADNRGVTVANGPY